ncbi:MAG: DUF998 domain-containing protein [Bacteroidota bacterium]
MKRNRKLVYLGFVIPLIFWSTIIICGLMTENYNHLTNLVSELGAIGTKTQYIFTSGLVLSSILSILFIIGLYKISKEIGLRSIPILFILTFSFSIFGAAIFPLPLNLHAILGSPSMLLPMSPLLTLILWKEDKIPNIKIASGIILIIMLLGFLTLAPNIMDNYFGLKQRFFHIGWTLWFIYLSQIFLGLDKNLIGKEKPSH